MRRPIVNFLLLVLGISLNSTPDIVHPSTGVTKTLPKESLNSTQGKGALAAWFRRLWWCKDDQAVTVWLKPVAMTVCIEVIVKLLGGLFGGLPFWGDWLQLGGTSLCRTLSLFLGALGGGCGEDWTTCIACV